MDLIRRNLLVYGFLGAIWVLVLGWQAQEHIRVREAAKTDLRNRSKDIAKFDSDKCFVQLVRNWREIYVHK